MDTLAWYGGPSTFKVDDARASGIEDKKTGRQRDRQKGRKTDDRQDRHGRQTASNDKKAYKPGGT
jgi:hypothetical protein